MENSVLEFITNEAKQSEGLGDAGIETFRDNPYASCAREAGQNAKDAEFQSPVKMTFDVLEINRNDIPCYLKLAETVDNCLKLATQERELDFFGKAKRILISQSMKVLKIADYNTLGLAGPASDSDSPFNSLLKSNGKSKKEKLTSGGSFGIGKNASFAVSDLRTVFYSTKYIDKNTNNSVCLSQGKVKLISHLDSEGVERMGTGYWGNGNFSAIDNEDDIPFWMRRSEIGTSIFSVGFDETSDWKYRIVYSLIVNFFCAIHRQEMEFQVDNGSININTNTLENLFGDINVIEAAKRSGHYANLKFSDELYHCYKSPNASITELDIEGLGKIRIHVLIQEGYSRRVGFIRNGMFITKSLDNFGHALERFPGAKEFVALVEPSDESANKMLKNLENPAHDGFSAERFYDQVKRNSAHKAMTKLGSKIREIIKSKTKSQEIGSVVLDELANLFARKGDTSADGKTSDELDPEILIYETPKRSNSKEKPKEGDSGGAGEKGNSTSDQENGAGKNNGNGIGSKAGSKGFLLTDIRNFFDGEVGKNSTHRIVNFTPSISGKIILNFYATGLTDEVGIKLTSCSEGVFSNDCMRVHMDVESQKRKKLKICFAEPYDGPIEIRAVMEMQ